MSGGFTGWWFAPAPARRLATLRIIVGLFGAVYALARVLHFGDYGTMHAEGFAPIGVVSLLLDAPLPPSLTWPLAIATPLAGAAFVAGFRFSISGPLFAALLLWVTTYHSSWGMIFHTENLLVMHIGILAIASSADSDGEDGRYGWPIRLMCTVTVLTYVIAGIAKLRITGIDWAFSDFLRNYVAYDALRKIELGSIASPIGIWFLQFEAIWQPLAAISLAAEVGAPIALLSKKTARAWVAVVWAFHVGVLAIMAIGFFYPISGIAFASFFEVEKISDFVRSKWRARRMVKPT